MSDGPTLQQQMQATLAKLPIPYKRINCYGNQIVVTAWSQDAANRWASVISQFATVRTVKQVYEETKDPTPYLKANPGLTKQHFYHEVWRVYAHV